MTMLKETNFKSLLTIQHHNNFNQRFSIHMLENNKAMLALKAYKSIFVRHVTFS